MTERMTDIHQEPKRCCDPSECHLLSMYEIDCEDCWKAQHGCEESRQKFVQQHLDEIE